MKTHFWQRLNRDSVAMTPQVVRAHDGQPAQLKVCQQMLKESYACRTFDINFTHTQMEALLADAMALLAHCPRCPVRFQQLGAVPTIGG